MKFRNLIILFLIVIGQLSCNQQAQKNAIVTSGEDQQIYERVDSLMAQMTFEEKIGQLSQRVVNQIDNKLEQDIRQGKVGSVLVKLDLITGPEVRNRIQKIAVEGSRLGIPIIFGQDVIHGFKTIFPIVLAQSCSWDTAMVRQANAIAAKEASTFGIDWTFAPMVDVSRDPRWGRIAECYGEDTYLNACFAASAVNGFQGNNISLPDKMVACMKHFVGYGAAMGGRDYQYTEISERAMHEVYLPPFKAAVDAGVLTVMSAFNDINGVPASANATYLKSVLKEDWGFRGFVVSDWDAIEQLIYHGYAADSIEAAVKSLTAGVDMEMKSGILYQLKQGEISDKVIDEAVKRVLYVKFKKGLFAHPYTNEERVKHDLLTDENRAFARQVAADCMVLLENKNNLLPIQNKPLTVAVVGPFAKEQNLMGWWRSNGNKADVVTPYDGLAANAPSQVQVTDQASSQTDLIVVCVGERYDLFGENNCRSEINLPEDQSELIAGLKKLGKPVVTVVFNGRPLDLTAEKTNSDALLLAWHPGTEAGNALADVLFGTINPSGKLTTSFPASIGHLPVYYNHRNSGRPKSNNYKGESPAPLYPFGYGLSYSSFKYSDLNLSADQIDKVGQITVSATITNTSQTDGTEIVQLYVQDIVGSTTRPVKELKGFQKIQLKAGESQQVSFNLKATDLTVLDENLKPVVEPGKFNVWIASCSDNGLMKSFAVVK